MKKSPLTLPDEREKLDQQTYRVYADETPTEAAQSFERRYGSPPARVIPAYGRVYCGPVAKD